MSNYIPCNRKINVHHYDSKNKKAWEEVVIAFEISENGALIPLVLGPNGFIRDLKVEDKNSYLVVDGVEIEYSKKLTLRDLLKEKEEE